MFGLFGGPQIDGEYFSADAGRVCWTELLTREPAAVEGFYDALFGWRAETDQSGDTPYTVFKIEDEMVAGMMMMPDDVPAEAPNHWGVYFTVAGCAAAEKKAFELGGQVLVPTMTIEMGKFAVLADPQGAKFSIMEYAAA